MEGKDEGKGGTWKLIFSSLLELYPGRTKLNSESQEHLITSHLKGGGQP